MNMSLRANALAARANAPARAQVALVLTGLNVAYKVSVVIGSCRLQALFSQFEQEKNEMLDANKPAVCCLGRAR